NLATIPCVARGGVHRPSLPARRHARTPITALPGGGERSTLPLAQRARRVSRSSWALAALRQAGATARPGNNPIAPAAFELSVRLFPSFVKETRADYLFVERLRRIRRRLAAHFE